MIVHLLLDEKFTSDFISLVNQEFNRSKKEHIFLIVTRHEQLRYEIKTDAEITFVRPNIISLFTMARSLWKADRIIVHGLFSCFVYILYFLGIGKKVIWAIWGGDLYNYQKEKGLYKSIKHKLVKNFYGVATPVKGDVELAQDVYGFNGKYYSSLMYLSNVIKETEESQYVEHEKYTVLVGNSADDENRHKYILKKIENINLKNVRFIIPLSYGSQNYADEVETAYKAKYGDNVLCLRKFIPKEEYIKLLSEVDVVLFAHNRQQGIGNLVQLINAGAKIYLESYVTTYDWLLENGIKVFDFESIDEEVLTPLTHEEKLSNRKQIRLLANQDELVKSLYFMFTDVLN